MNSLSSPRRTHRKRVSALRLSSDTTATLPEYASTPWNPRDDDPVPSDRPPDYPDSAEEADEDTDTESGAPALLLSPISASNSPRHSPRTPSSPRRGKQRFPTHRRRQSAQSSSSSDPYLDSLLERSVHALEMSNTLLQSSISTQTSLTTILGNDSPAERTLEARAQILSSRIRNNWDTQQSWADDLAEISENVEGLFGDEARSRKISTGSISSSLPSASSPLSRRRLRRPPSLDLRQASDPIVPRLHLSSQGRSDLIAPPPRALTQYVASTQDSSSLVLPSTLGLRAPPSTHLTPEWRPLAEAASSSTLSLHSSAPPVALPPTLTDKPIEPSTAAYNMLSSFVYRTGSSGTTTPSTSFTSSFMRRRGSSAGSSTEGTSVQSLSRKSPERTYRSDSSGGTSRTSRSRTPRRGISPPAHAMGAHQRLTPPLEESSSSDSCVAKRTIVSLRKILDEQPSSSSLLPGAASPSKRPRTPAFMPRTPAPLPAAGTSTATASISRLFTKGTHSSSTRPPSPPRQSAMKRPSPNNTSPLPSPSTPSPSAVPSLLSIPDLLTVSVKALGRGGSATPSSGLSTPKRISFAELPESYASSRPEGTPSKFKEKKNRRKRGAGAGKGKGRGSDGSGTEGSGGWWTGWLGSAGVGMSIARHEEKMEDRMSRSWGGRMSAGGPGLDEWAV